MVLDVPRLRLKDHVLGDIGGEVRDPFEVFADAQHAQKNEGKTPRDAIVEACLIRFRPIMMTTMSALMGTLPLRDWLRGRFGIKASPRHCGGGRAIVLAVPDAVCNAGFLSLHGPTPGRSPAYFSTGQSVMKFSNGTPISSSGRSAKGRCNQAR